MIATSRLYSTFKWKTFKKYLPIDVFSRLLVCASQKFISSTGNYLECAINLVELVDAKADGLDLLTQMLIDHLKQTNIFRGEDVSKALRFYNSWIVDDTLDSVYTSIY